MSVPTETAWDALRARAEAAEAARDRMRAQAEAAEAELSASRMRWRDTLDALEARWSRREARREVAQKQEMDALRSELIGWRERAKEAEAKVETLNSQISELGVATFDMVRVASDAKSAQRETEATLARYRLALRIIAGQEQCLDNLMSNADVASAALSGGGDG